MDQIWPSDKGRRAEINGRGNLITDDINRNVYNPRMQKLKDADQQKAREAMRNSAQQSSSSARPYKNQSNVFTHLVDDPTTRAKPAPRQQASEHPSSQASQMTGYRAAAAQAYGAQAPTQAPARAPAQAHGEPNLAQAYADQDMLDRMMAMEQQKQQVGGKPPMGKRPYERDYTTVANGSVRLYGGDRVDHDEPALAQQRTGKRQMGLPSQQNGGQALF